MQLPIAAQSVAHAALRPRKRRRIEDNQIILCPCFFGSAQKLKYILLYPADLYLIARSVSLRSGNAFRIFFNSGYFRCALARTRQRKRALICEAIQNTSVACVVRDNSVVVLLIEIQTGLVPAQEIDFKFHTADFDYRLRRRSAHTAA